MTYEQVSVFQTIARSGLKTENEEVIATGLGVAGYGPEMYRVLEPSVAKRPGGFEELVSREPVAMMFCALQAAIFCARIRDLMFTKP